MILLYKWADSSRHIWWYTVALAPVAIWTALSSVGGPMTLVVFTVLNAIFLKGAWDIWRRDEATAEGDEYAVEKKVFKFSILYLFANFGVLLAEAALKLIGLGGW